MPRILINPYEVEPPVAGGDFYGRWELLSRVYQALQQSNVVLIEAMRSAVVNFTPDRPIDLVLRRANTIRPVRHHKSMT